MTHTNQDHTPTWVDGFQRLVVLCVENRTFAADNGFAFESRRLAVELSGQHLRAKDIARIHRDALADLVDGEAAPRAHALLDAGEETLIAVLGHLADSYLVAQDRPADITSRSGAGPTRTTPARGRPEATEPTPRRGDHVAPEHAELRLHLVVAGHTARTRKLERVLKEIVTLRAPATTEILVSDLAAQPELFEQLEVLATPVIIREVPAPQRRLVGSGADLDRILDELEISVPVLRPPAPVEAPASIAQAPGRSRARPTG